MGSEWEVRGWDCSFLLVTLGDHVGNFWFSFELSPCRVLMVQSREGRRRCEGLLLSVQFVVITAKFFL